VVSRRSSSSNGSISSRSSSSNTRKLCEVELGCDLEGYLRLMHACHTCCYGGVHTGHCVSRKGDEDKDALWGVSADVCVTGNRVGFFFVVVGWGVPNGGVGVGGVGDQQQQ